MHTDQPVHDPSMDGPWFKQIIAGKGQTQNTSLVERDCLIYVFDKLLQSKKLPARVLRVAEEFFITKRQDEEDIDGESTHPISPLACVQPTPTLFAMITHTSNVTSTLTS